MKKDKILAGIADLLTENAVLADGETEIDEFIDEKEPAPAPEPKEEPKEEVELDENPTEDPDIDIDIPVVLDEPYVDEVMDLKDDDDEDDDIDIDETPETSPFEEMKDVEEPEHNLPESASSFLDQLEIPKSNARLERFGAYDVVVLGPNVALTRAQMRGLMRSGLIAMTAEDTGGLAFVYPASRF